MGTLNLTREQRHAVDVASDLGNIQKPTAISGPAGSGKTLVAAVTAERLASQGTLFEDAADERVYFVTYTNELVNYVSRQLPDIVGSETAHVAVRTVHAYLKTFLKKNGFEKYRYVNNENNEGRRSFINRYLDRSKEELSLSGCLADAAFLDEEIGWLLGQGIRSLNRYLEVKRVGSVLASRVISENKFSLSIKLIWQVLPIFPTQSKRSSTSTILAIRF